MPYCINFTEIETLDLSSNWTMYAGVRLMTDKLCQANHLKSLDLSATKLFKLVNDVPSLIQIFDSLKYLEELKLNENNMTDSHLI